MTRPVTYEIAELRERVRALEADVRPVIVGGKVAQINVQGPTKEHEHTGTGEGGLIDSAPITYTPSVLADWDSSADPGNVDDALNQLAERVKDLEGGGASALTALYEIPADSQTLTAGSETTVLLDYGFANALTYTIEESTGGAGDTGFSGIIMQPDLTFSHDSAAIWMYGVLWNPQIIANNIDFDVSAAFVNDARYLIDGTSSFGITYGHVDHPQFKTSGGTTTTMSEYNAFTSLGQREIDAGWTITTYRDFYVKTDTSDAGVITTKIGLDIEAFNEGATKIGIRSAQDIRLVTNGSIGASLNLWSGGAINLYSNTGTTQTGSWDAATGLFRLLGTGKTYTADTSLMSCTSDIQMSSPAASFSFYTSQNLITYAVTNSFAFMFHHNSTHQVNTGSINAPIPLVFADRGTIQTNAQTATSLGYASFYSAPTTARAGGSGALTVTTLEGLRSDALIGANTTVDSRTGIRILNPTTMAGTLTLQIGVDIEALTSATTDIGIRNASNMRQTGYASFIGSTSAPNNTGNGEVTMSRLNIGNVAFANAGLEFQMTGQGVIDGALLISSAAALPTNANDGEFTALRGAFVSADAAFPNSEVRLWAHQGTIENEVFRFSSTSAGTRNPTRFHRHYELQTTGAGSSTETIAVPTGTTWLVWAAIVATQSGGAGGTVGDSAGYIARCVVRNQGGTATVGSLITVVNEVDTAWTVTFSTSTSNLQVNVAGNTNDTVEWHIHMDIYQIAHA